MSMVSQFNARNATAAQIAKDFVVPDYFNEVIRYQNVVLVGPRGIGKTTLLKALTSPGLSVLHRRPELQRVLQGEDFEAIPIYIPAESIWKGTSGLVRSEVSASEDQDLILGGMFTDHCLYQVISSFEEAAKQHRELAPRENFPWVVEVSDEIEARICSTCSTLWLLETPQKSFLGLKLQLLKRANLYRAAIDQKAGSSALDAVRKLGRIDFLLMLKGFFDIAETYTGVARWTVSFDEMEIAPKAILAHLYQNLRSFDQRAALRFSMFPYVDFYEERGGFMPSQIDPNTGQDYHPVILSNKFSNAKHTFAKELITVECERRGRSLGEFIEYMNSSRSIIPGSRKFTDVSFERQPEKIFDHSLKNSGDIGLRDHLAAKGIERPEDITGVREENKRAEVIRKIFPIAELRAYYFSRTKRKLGGDSRARRSSAKGYGYYHGFSQLLALTEGNPRAIKYYLNELLDDLEAGKDSSRSQNSVIPQNVDRFRAMIASQAISEDASKSGYPSALKIVDALGFALADGVLSETFHPEPALSYRLKNIHPSLKEGLISAVNSGALIVEQSASAKQLLFDLEGCRIRISHRLAPFYKLPTISGQERSLSSLPQTKLEDHNQPDLLAWAGLDD